MDEMELIKKREIDGKIVEMFFEKQFNSWVVTVSKLTAKGWKRLVSVSSPDKNFILETYNASVLELTQLDSLGAI